jgi:hypothetical protein
MKRLENAGFEWKLLKTFDDRFNDLVAFKAKFGHCNVPSTKSNNNKHSSLDVPGWYPTGCPTIAPPHPY